jgi:hypothetical protein
MKEEGGRRGRRKEDGGIRKEGEGGRKERGRKMEEGKWSEFWTICFQ